MEHMGIFLSNFCGRRSPKTQATIARRSTSDETDHVFGAMDVVDTGNHELPRKNPILGPEVHISLVPPFLWRVARRVEGLDNPKKLGVIL